MGGLHRRLLFGLLLSSQPPLLTRAVDLLVWGRYCPSKYSSCSSDSSYREMTIPNATRAEIEAAGGIARLVGNDNAFAVVTVEQRLLAWGDSWAGGTIPAATRRELDAATDVSGKRFERFASTLETGMPPSHAAQEVFRHAKEGLFYCVVDNDFERDGFSGDLDKQITDRYLAMMSRRAPDVTRASPVTGANRLLRKARAAKM